MLKKLLCLALACICVLTFAACGDDKGGKDKGSSSAAPSGDRVTSGGITTSVEDDKVLETELATKNYEGKEFKLYYWYQYGENIDRKISAFNEAHNAKITTEIGTSFAEDIAQSIAAGTPYDLVSNHADYFPQAVISNLFEPLDAHLGNDLDFFNKDKPANGGFSKNIINAFTWDNKKYAVGSANSIYSMVFYYNKKAFGDAGLEDPYTLWKEGKWTWDKCVEMSSIVTDVENETVFLEGIALSNWMTLNGCSYVKVDGMTATENLGDAKVLAAITSWKDLYIGENPMCMPTYSDLFGGSAYAAISYTDVYATYSDKALASSAFDQSASNLGVVPMPTGLIEEGMYAGHVAQGYSAAKGAKDTSVAACYALFESRTTDAEVGVTTQMPSEILNAVNTAFATNGFLGFAGWKDSNGVSPNTYLKEIGEEIKTGADVASTVAAKRPEITRCIADTLALIK